MKKFLAIPTTLALAFFAVASVTPAHAQVAATPNLLVSFVSDGVALTAVGGAQDSTLANIRLDATTSSEDIRLNSIPFILSTGNGARATDLNECHIVSSTAVTSPLNNSSANALATLSTGNNTVTFDSSLIIPRGSVMNLLVRCDVASSMVSGGTYQFSINTSNVVATGAVTGIPAVVGIARATTGTVVVPPVVVVPGVPNTGFGGYATSNILMILGALGVAGLGLTYARKASR